MIKRHVSRSDLEAAIRQAWSKDISEDPDDWTPENPARGQCGATAYVIYQHLGGLLLMSDVFRDGQRVETHWWNRLPTGEEIDLTREQFLRGETFGEPKVIDPAAHGSPNPEAMRRIEALSSRVDRAYAS